MTKSRSGGVFEVVSQMLSPGNDSWHIMSFFSVYSEINRNSIEIGLSAHFLES